MTQAVDALDDLLLDDLVKGIPGGTRAVRLGDVARMGWNVLREDLPLPVAVLKTSALEGNGRWMAGFLEASGARIAPHGKTTMSPQLFQRQLADGAWAITVATVAQLQVCRRFGLSRIVLANQLVGRQAIRYVIAELAADPGFEFYALADSVEAVTALAHAVRDSGLQRPVNLLLEGGIEGGRTGVRDMETGLAVARAVKSNAPYLALRGVEGFEGLIHGADAHDQDRKVEAFLDFLCRLAAACQSDSLFASGPVILSAGGSAYYDMVVDRFAKAAIDNALLVTRSGCYLTQDSAMYRRAYARIRERSAAARDVPGALAPALELWAYVQSRPESRRAILTVGKRDLSHDADPPVIRAWFRPGTAGAPEAAGSGYAVVELNDQHAHVTLPEACPWRVGDLVALGVSHPCTTFDKWQALYLVDDAYTVTGAVRTFF